MALDHWVGLGDLAAFMDVAVADLDTALANLALSAAEQRIRNYTDQQITYLANDLVYLDGNGRRKLRLPERPVVSVISVEEGSGDPVWTVLDADNYHLRGSVLIRWDGSVWNAGEANVRVTYHHGWLTSAIGVDSDISDSDFTAGYIPADLSLATLSMARRVYEDLGTSGGTLGDIKQETIGSYSYTLSTVNEAAGGVELTLPERAVLDSYKMNGWTAH